MSHSRLFDANASGSNYIANHDFSSRHLQRRLRHRSDKHYGRVIPPHAVMGIPVWIPARPRCLTTHMGALLSRMTPFENGFSTAIPARLYGRQI